MALVPVRCLSGVLVVTLLSAACASYSPINPADIPSSLTASDTVRVVTRDGRESQFEIVAITPDAIVGEVERIQFADVKELDRVEKISLVSVGLVVATIVLLGGLVILLVWLSDQPRLGRGAR
jgi:hypothetical protein